MDNKIFITGGTGFIGKNLIPKLVIRGYKIYALARTSEKASELNKLNVDRVVIGDITKPKTYQSELNKCDILIHLAALRTNWAKQSEFDRVNSDVLKNLLLPNSKLKYAIITSSVYVHGKLNRLPANEETPLNASDLYGKSKIKTERFTKKLCKKFNIPFTIIRPAIVYGPGDNENGMVSKMIQLIIANKMPVIGDGNNLIHLVYVDDLTDAYIKILQKKAKNETYIIAGEKPIKLKNLISLIKREAGVSYQPKHYPKILLLFAAYCVKFIYQNGLKINLSFFKNTPPILPVQIINLGSSWQYDIEKANSELNYHPKINYPEGIKFTLRQVMKDNTKISEGGITLKNNSVYFGGVSVPDLVEEYKTPILVFSEGRILDNFRTLKSVFEKNYQNSDIYYSVKTNYELQILKTLKKAGSKAEAASALEVEMALKAGFKPEDIIIDGPAWTDDEIDYCIRKNIHLLNVDSVDLMHRVNEVAKKNKKRVNVSYRIYPEIKMSILKSFIEGYISKFGIPASDALEAYKIAQEMKFVNPIATSSHIGSMITDPGYYEKAIDKYIELAHSLKQKLNINIKEINIGGGYGVQSLNYFSLESAILEKTGIKKYKKAASIEEFGNRIGRRFSDKLKEYRMAYIKLALEPGRFVVSDGGIMITKVVSVKKDWIFLDGGINLIPESIFFIRRGFIVANKLGQKSLKKYNIAGPTLNTADVLADKQKLPEMKVGDTVIVLDAGAYSLSRSTQFTILRPAALYITKNKKIKFLRKAEKSLDLLSKLI